MTDLRYAFRTLTQRPGFSVAAILSLAIGIAANTAVFSVTNGLLFKGVPGVHRTEGLVHITHDVRGDAADIPFAVGHRIRAEQAVVQQTAAYAVVSLSITADGEAQRLGGLAVDADYFPLLGVRVARGRLFSANEASFPAVAPVAVISEHLWRRELGGRDDAIGRMVRVNGVPVRVIGVVGDGFTGHHVGLRLDLFVPLGLAVPGLPSATALTDVSGSSVEMLARLQPDVATATAARQLTASVARFRSERGIQSAGGTMSIGVNEWGPLPLTIRGPSIVFLVMLSVLVALALSMACMNVTTMLLARATERRSEIAIRQALGASRWRLARQMLTEALVLFTIAGSVGTIAAMLLARSMSAFSPGLPVPGRLGADFQLDIRVLLVALVVTLGTGVLFSLTPALHASRFDVVSALKDAGSTTRARTRFRSILVSSQVCVTTMLLVAAGLFVTSLGDLRDADTGFRAESVQVLEMDVELRGASAAQGVAFFETLLERVRAIPGVSSVSLAAKLPMAGCSSLGSIHVAGAITNAQDVGTACFNRVTPDYFRTLSIPILQGRDVEVTDGASSQSVALVNETMARRLFGEARAVGRRFTTGTGEFAKEWTVIGVVGNAKYRSLSEPPASFYYIPARQMYNSQMVLHVKSAPEAMGVISAEIRRLTKDIDPYLPLGQSRPLVEALDLIFLPQRIASWVASIMGVFALLLATIGVYGVTAYMVRSRAREVGIRLALGATSRDIVGLVLRRQLLAPAIGMTIGLMVGVTFAFGIRNVMRSVDPANPLAFGGVPLLIAGIAVLATFLPAWRLLRGTPMSILTER